MKKATINKIIPFSNVDGPGNRMAIFFQGCNFDCAYCHNPETLNFCNHCGDCISHCPATALSNPEHKIIWNSAICTGCDTCTQTCPTSSSPKTRQYTVDELLQEVDKVQAFISGITVSGGECSLQHKFITDFFHAVKDKYPRLSCFVDTNGSLHLACESFADFIQITDYFMLDIKAWDEDEHIKLTGKSNEAVLENLYYLKKLGKLFEVRTVVVPEYLNNQLTVEQVAEAISHSAIKYKLIKYRSNGVRKEKLAGISSPGEQYMQALQQAAISRHAGEVVII
ncbi:MAG: YjjW family glycine radical enzyme activase [Iodobacter sp.]